MPYGSKSELPPAVKKLPAHAQDIFQKAFNAAHKQYNGDEDKAFAVAWAAVKDKYKKQGEEWVAKDAASVLCYDTLALDDGAIKQTGEGYLVATPRVARADNIQLYRGTECGRPDVERVRVYRPADEVFDEASLRTYAHRPITNRHPSRHVDSKTIKRVFAGMTGSKVVRDGEFIRVDMSLMDQASIEDFKAGRKQLSLGYQAELVWEPGRTDDGREFDAIQTNIRANHLAIVDAARGGPMLCIGDSFDDWLDGTTEPQRRSRRLQQRSNRMKTLTIDGISVEVDDDQSAQIITRRISTLEGQVQQFTQQHTTDEATIADLRKQLGSKDGELAGLQQKVKDAEMTPQKLDGLVMDRASVVLKAKSILGDAFDPTGKSNIEIKRAVVATRLKDAATGMKDEYVEGAFMTLTADAKSANGGAASHMATTLSRPGFGDAKLPDPALAYEERNRRLQDAHKGGDKANW